MRIRTFPCVVCLVVLGSIVAGAQPKPASSTVTSAASRVALDAIPANVNFDVVSFKPCPPDKEGDGKVDMPNNADYIAYHCENMAKLVYFAYNGLVHITDFVGNDADWMYSDHYEFIAKVAPDDIPAWQKLDITSRRILMRSLLAKVLKLKVSVYTMPDSVYFLKVAKSGAQLTPYKEGDQNKMPDGRLQVGRVANWIGLVAYFQDTTMAQLAELMSGHLDKHVVDHTNLSGAYTFTIPLAFGGIDPYGHYPTPDDLSTAEGLSILGLHLETGKTPTDRLSIDHIERPEPN